MAASKSTVSQIVETISQWGFDFGIDPKAVTALLEDLNRVKGNASVERTLADVLAAWDKNPGYSERTSR
jgi:hypothetical protein